MVEWSKIILGARRAKFEHCFVRGEFAVFRKALNAVHNGDVAFLLVDKERLPGGNPGLMPIPNHWVLLLDGKIKRSNVDFEIYTWGDDMSLTISKDAFEDMLFGAVIAEF